MSVMLALITATVLILFGVLRSRKRREQPTPVLIQRFVHPGHAWARTTEDGYVLVGIDDFTQSVIGPVGAVKLPRLLRHVRQGVVAWELSRGGRTLPMVSPVSGWVIEKNEAVLRTPGLLNSSPYGEGWLFKVKPHRLSAELHNMLTGKSAQQWQGFVGSQLGRFFSGTPALMYQDGGVMLTNLADRCSEDEWQALCKEFFLIDESSMEKKS